MKYLLLIFFLVFNSILATIESENRINIRHGRSRSKLLRTGKHSDDIHEDMISLTQSTSPSILSNDVNATKYSAPVVESNVKKKVGNETKKKDSKQKGRKVTVNGNNTWMHMDRSVMYMGERALDGGKANKKFEELNRKRQQQDEENGDDEDLDSSLDNYLDENVEKIAPESGRSGLVDIVTRFLRIVESQHLLGENCTAGTDLNLGEGVVDRYAQERFRIEADVAVNRANMLTRIWKYADPAVLASEYLLHASVFSMVEFDDDIFAAGNCYDYKQYKDYVLFCPYAYRLPDGTILVKDLAIEYKYLSNTSEWFYIARKNAENVIKNYNQFSKGKCFFFLILTESNIRKNFG